jgi:hypothetical protein
MTFGIEIHVFFYETRSVSNMQARQRLFALSRAHLLVLSRSGLKDLNQNSWTLLPFENANGLLSHPVLNGTVICDPPHLLKGTRCRHRNSDSVVVFLSSIIRRIHDSLALRLFAPSYYHPYAKRSCFSLARCSQHHRMVEYDPNSNDQEICNIKSLQSKLH